jgi:enoyl-CoA hydratase
MSQAETPPPVLYEKRGRSAWILLNRPERQNALSPAMIEAIDGAFGAAGADDDVRAVVITGVGPDFCVGADLTTIPTLAPYRTRALFGDRMGHTGEVFRRVAAFPKPVVAAVSGLVRAGGLELMLCCDLVVAGRGARFGDGHSPYGQLPGGGSSVRLPRLIGAARAKYLFFTGELVPASTFLDWGVVNEVVEDDDVQAAAERLASLLVTRSSESIRRLKRLIDDGLAQPLDSALRLEILTAEINLGSDDAAEGFRAGADGREPQF